MSALHVRPARAEDVDRLVAIHLAAFPDDRGAIARKRNFEQNVLGPLDRLRVLEAGGVIVAHAFLFALETFFGGRAVKAAGIASVGIAPEARGRGLASHLLGAIESEARERGDALAMLYPYRQGFYRKLGYATVTPSWWLESNPRAVPQGWVDRARATSLEALRAPGASDLPRMQRCWLRAAKRSTGLFVRPEAMWERKCLDDRRHVVVFAREDEDEIAGYVAFQHEQDEAHADVLLRVDELVADDDEARRVLFGVLGMQRDQVRAFCWRAAQHDPFVLAFEDADRDSGGSEHVEHALGTLVAGPMVKLLDVERALGARGYAHDGVASFEVGGRASFTLRVAEGKAHVSAHAAGNENAAVFTHPGLASVLFGGVRAIDAARLGWLSGDSAGAKVEALDRLLRLPAFEVVDPF